MWEKYDDPSLAGFNETDYFEVEEKVYKTIRILSVNTTITSSVNSHISDLFSINNENKETKNGLITQQQHDVDGISEFFDVTDDDKVQKSVETRLEAMFGESPVHMPHKSDVDAEAIESSLNDIFGNTKSPIVMNDNGVGIIEAIKNKRLWEHEINNDLSSEATNEYQTLHIQEYLLSTDDEDDVTEEVTIQPSVGFNRIGIPRFSGNLSEWRQFYKLFNQIVHQQNIRKALKMLYLKDNLSGEAAEVIQHLMVSDCNYDTACTILNNKYSHLWAAILADEEEEAVANEEEEEEEHEDEIEEEVENHLELREELEYKKGQYEKMRTESQEWYVEAKRLEFEVNVLRERAERANRLEFEVDVLLKSKFRSLEKN